MPPGSSPSRATGASVEVLYGPPAGECRDLWVITFDVFEEWLFLPGRGGCRIDRREAVRASYAQMAPARSRRGAAG